MTAKPALGLVALKDVEELLLAREAPQGRGNIVHETGSAQIQHLPRIQHFL
jgi:hypothetical protein